MANLEIEKKWSFDEDPRDYIKWIFKEDHVVFQWYLVATDDVQVRVSKRLEDNGDRYTLNIKNGNGLIRKEVKIDITYKDFLDLIAQCDGSTPIKKHLFVFYLPNHRLLEISQIDDDWWYGEVEFESEEEANEFQLNKYISGIAIHDETNNPDYAMKNYWRRTRMEDE